MGLGSGIGLKVIVLQARRVFRVKMRVFTCLQVALGHNEALEQQLGCSGPFWSRQYYFWHEGQPLTLIHEVFSNKLEAYLGPQHSSSSGGGSGTSGDSGSSGGSGSSSSGGSGGGSDSGSGSLANDRQDSSSFTEGRNGAGHEH
jgi:uncharacterized membrane protein YgcG